MLVIVAAGVANWRDESSAYLLEPPRSADEPRLTSCKDAIAIARNSPYWRKQSLPNRFAVECRPAPGGWQFKARMIEAEVLCELYVGRDRLIVPRLPCQGVGEGEDDLQRHKS